MNNRDIFKLGQRRSCNFIISPTDIVNRFSSLDHTYHLFQFQTAAAAGLMKLLGFHPKEGNSIHSFYYRCSLKIKNTDLQKINSNKILSKAVKDLFFERQLFKNHNFRIPDSLVNHIKYSKSEVFNWIQSTLH